MNHTTISIQPTCERHAVVDLTPKQVATLIANATGQVAIWTGKVRAEWHVTDKRTNKVLVVIY